MISGFEIGWPIRADHALVQGYSESPVAYALKSNKRPRPAWDQTAILYAAHGLRDYWTAEGPGRCKIRDEGESDFELKEAGKHYVLREKMAPKELAKLISDMQVQAEKRRLEAK